MDSQDAFDSQFQDSQPSSQRDESDVKRMKQVRGPHAALEDSQSSFAGILSVNYMQSWLFMLASTTESFAAGLH